MLLSNKLTYCITAFILLAFVAGPVMAHDGNHPVNEAILGDNPATPDTVETDFVVTAAHNGHPVPVLSSGDDATTVTDNKDGNRIKVVEVDDDTNTGDVDENAVSRKFTLLVDFGTTTVVGQSDLLAIEYVDPTADPLVESDDSIPDLAFTTLLLDADGRLVAGTGITSGAIDAAGITIARVEDSTTQIMVTIVLPAAAVPDGTGTATDGTADDEDDAFDSIILRIRVDATGDTATDGVFSLATRPGFDVVPGGRMMMQSNLLELTLVDDVGEEPEPTAAVVETIAAGGINADGDVDFTITFDKALIDTQTFTLGDVDTITGGRPVDFVPDADGMTFVLTVRADEITESITVAVGEISATSDPGMADPEYPALDLRVVAPAAPNDDGKLVFTITSNVNLVTDLTIHHFDIDTREVEELASGDLVMTEDADLPDGVAEQYMLTVTPKPGVTSVLVELRAGVSTYMRDHDNDPETAPMSTLTPTREGHYRPETGKPTIAFAISNLDTSGLAENPGHLDSIDGGMVTITASDTIDGDLTSQITITTNPDTSEVKVSGGKITAVDGASFTLIPDNGAITVQVTVVADAVRDAAGNGNVATTSDADTATAGNQPYTVGPWFDVPANTILVIHKSRGATHKYLSDQPRLPINQQPPTPAPLIKTDVWNNMPDLEVLFSHIASGTNQNFGGTLNLTEAYGQAELTQTRDGGNGQHNSVRISEIMWASDLALRGGINDDEASEQWVEISNGTGATVKIFLFARTGLDSARNVDDVEDRVGNAYNGSPGSAVWTVPGQNGNSHTGGTTGNFISMHRRWDGAHSRGYVNGTGSGNWSASDRRYLTSTAFPNLIPQGIAPYDFVGSPGRPHSINLPKPSTRADVTAIPGAQVAEDEKLIINEVSNRVDARYEWIELRNVGNQAADLWSFRISKVTAVGTDQPLIDLAHNESYKIPVGGVLLLVATDPRYDDDHPLAVGYNIDVNENDQVAGIGLIEDGSPRKEATARYKVVNFQNGGLDDDGEFILIVRSPDHHKGDHRHGDGDKGRAELGTADLDRISDIAGFHPDLVGPDNYPATNPPNLNKTQLWPLVNFNGDMRPNEVDRNNRTNRLEAGKVRYRHRVVTQHANAANRGTPGNRAGTGVAHHDRHTGHYAFVDAGYTGWGYKRTARRDLRVHNGTPGYHGRISNTTTKTDTAKATVVISEIMYSTGSEDASLPQWVELYNSSATQAVHLGSGWKLKIEELDADGNPRDKLVEINFASHGRVKHIYPQQTVLIAAGNARQSGSDSQPSRVVFPDNRVFNVYRDIGAGKLGGDDGTNTRYQFFNPNAFALVLVDKDGKVADMTGNLDGDPRTSDTVAAGKEIPSAITVDPRTNISRRTSIIRVHDDGVARDGMLPIMPVFKKGGTRINSDDVDPKWGWIPAVNTEREFKITIKSTWYGDEDDYGTPGHRPGLVLPVELSHFRPTLEDGTVTIRWTTESELDNAGFNIYRSDTREGEYKQVNAELIEGAGTTGERNTYKWVDQTAKPGVVYYYQIEDVSFAGERQALAITKLKGLITAGNKLTTTWSELKASQ